MPAAPLQEDAGDEKDDALESAEDADTAIPDEKRPFHVDLEQRGCTQGFIRFLRINRSKLCREAGLHVIDPDPALLGIRARMVWLALEQKEQRRYQADAVRAFRAAGLMAASSDDETPEANATPPLALSDSAPAAPVTPNEMCRASAVAQVDPYMDGTAHATQDNVVAPPATSEDVVPKRKARARKRRQASEAQAPNIDGFAEASPPARRSKQAKHEASGSQDQHNVGCADNEGEALPRVSISDLRKKARYFGAQPHDLHSCLERADLVNLLSTLGDTSFS